MRAVELSNYGAENELHYRKDYPIPTCKPNEVLIKVKACALGFLDMKVRKGIYRNLTQLPLIPGYEVSGVIYSVGSDVIHLKPGNEVVAISCIDSKYGGCAEYSLQPAINVAVKPEELSHEEACAALVPCLRAFTALYYQLHLRPHQFLLFLAPKTGAETIPAQLAVLLGARVIVVAKTSEAANMYNECPYVIRVIDLEGEIFDNQLTMDLYANSPEQNTNNEPSDFNVPPLTSVVDAVMEETGGMGVDCILDYQDLDAYDSPKYDTSIFETSITPNSSTNMNASNSDYTSSLTKDDGNNRNSRNNRSNRSNRNSHNVNSSSSFGEGEKEIHKTQKNKLRISRRELIRCLSVHGRWCTVTRNLQLDPPDSELLFLRGGSVSYLFEQVWLLASKQHGKYLHIIRDILGKLASGAIKSDVTDVFSIDKIKKAHQSVIDNKIGKVIIKM